VGFVPVLAVELAAFAGVFVFCLGLAVGLGGALCVLAEAEPAGAVACAPADPPAAGSAIISNESRNNHPAGSRPPQQELGKKWPSYPYF